MRFFFFSFHAANDRLLVCALICALFQPNVFFLASTPGFGDKGLDVQRSPVTFAMGHRWSETVIRETTAANNNNKKNTKKHKKHTQKRGT
jgi:hypothetical protein